jgi:hypothetical protein
MARRQDRVMALREVREAHSAVFEKLFDAGVFERKLDTLNEVIRNTPLPEERKQAIRVPFENWGLLNAPKEDVPPATPAQLIHHSTVSKPVKRAENTCSAFR